MNERKLDPGIVIVILLIALGIGLVLFIYSQLRVDEVSVRMEEESTVPLLIVVADQNRIYASAYIWINSASKRVALVDIPQNLGLKIDKLNRFDSLEVLYQESTMEQFTQSLSGLLGQEIPWYVKIDADDLVSLVDLMGGLSVFVPDSIDSNEQNDTIRIPSGNQTLDGGKVLDFLRYQESQARDLTLSNRRWTIVKALLQRWADQSDLSRNSVFRNLLRKHIDSNIDDSGLQSYFNLLAKTRINDLVTQRVIGTSRQVDIGQNSEKKTLFFPHFEGKLLKDSLRQIIVNLESPEEGKTGAVGLKVEVLNGTLLTGLARRTRELFSSFGIDVVTIGNALNTSVALTQVIDRRGNIAAANRVANIIKCEQIVTQIEGDGADGADVTVLLGRDFNGWTVIAK